MALICEYNAALKKLYFNVMYISWRLQNACVKCSSLLGTVESFLQHVINTWAWQEEHMGVILFVLKVSKVRG